MEDIFLQLLIFQQERKTKQNTTGHKNFLSDLFQATNDSFICLTIPWDNL